jgi:hypothetical protein
MLIAQEPATPGIFRLRRERLLAPIHIMLAVFALADAFPLPRHRAHAGPRHALARFWRSLGESNPLFFAVRGHNVRFSAFLRTVTDIAFPVITLPSLFVRQSSPTSFPFFPYGIFPWPGPSKTPKSTARPLAPNCPGGASPTGRSFRRDARSATGRRQRRDVDRPPSRRWQPALRRAWSGRRCARCRWTDVFHLARRKSGREPSSAGRRASWRATASCKPDPIPSKPRSGTISQRASVEAPSACEPTGTQPRP